MTPVAASLEVLLVEDDREDFEHAREMFSEIEAAKFQIHWARSLEEGVRAVRARGYDVCLLDQHLGDGTGVDFIREAKAHGCETPIIVLTGDVASSEREALESGAIDYLVKHTIDGERLWRSVRHALDRNRTLEQVRERDRLFRAVFDAAADGMLIADDQGRCVDANPAALSLLGFCRADVIGKRAQDFAASPVGLERAWLDFLSAGHAAGELEIRRGDGELRLLDLTARARILPNRHLSVVRDVTERRRAETMKTRLAAIVEAAEDAILAKDLDGRILEWNPGAERVYGCAAAEAIGTSVLRFVPEDRVAEWRDIHRRVHAGDVIRHLETTRRRADGRIIDVSLSVSPLRDDDGHVIGACTVTRDITETNQLRSRLSIADRMASVGTLAAGVAHEINNPLAAVVANLDFLSYGLASSESVVTGSAPDEEARAALRDALDASRRVQQIVRDLKLFSRPNDEVKSAVDVERALTSTIRMVWNEIRHRARLVKDFSECPPVDANESRLGQVFLNLLVNAAQAIPEGHAQTNEIRVKTSAEGGRVIVQISDTGAGISPETLRRVFEPFFTTKPVGHGTGLGLSIVHGIVTSLGGEISVTSEVGKGTTFRVSLPEGKLRDDGDDGLAEEPSSRARGQVLVIDDESLVVRAVQRTLGAHHDVTIATDPAAAIGRLRGGERYDIILCDLMMPNMSGMEVYGLVRQIDPALAERMVFLTGGAFTPSARQFLDAVPNPRIEKPFEAAELRGVVDRYLVGVPGA